MMARQGQNFVIPSRWIKIGVAILACGPLVGSAFGVGASLIVRDTTQENRINALEKQQDKIEERLNTIIDLLMERK